MFELNRDNVSEISYVDQPVSVLGAVALAYSAARVKVTLSSFRSYVSRGDAPAPAFREGRQPFWDSAEVRKWANEYASRTQGPVAEVEPPGPLLLSSWREPGAEIPGAGKISDLERAYLALEQLPKVIDRYSAMATGLAVRAQEFEEDLAMAPERPSFWANPAENWRAARALRAVRDGMPALKGRHLEYEVLRDQATAELEHVAGWLERAVAWLPLRAEVRRRQQLHSAFDDWLLSAALESVLPRGAVQSTYEFAVADPARVSYLLGGSESGGRSWPTRHIASHPEIPQNSIVLAGVDFGFRWHVYEEHGIAPAKSTPGVANSGGDWRIAWIPETHELYAELRDSGTNGVHLITTVPEVATFESMLTWLSPFESIQRFPGAFGLLQQEIAIQKSTGWRGLASLNLEERAW